MFVVTVTLSVMAPHATAFLEALRANAARSLAEEPGCHRFDICLDDDRMGQVFLYELYADKAAFDAHKATAHYAAFAEAAAEWVREKTVRTYRLDA
jgi:quinol monooxygenase YgiN